MQFHEKLSTTASRADVSVFVSSENDDALLLTARSKGMVADIHLTVAGAEELAKTLLDAVKFSRSQEKAIADAIDAVNSMTAEELQLLPGAANGEAV
jgi:hypothetical protein